jgi:two-component system, OmpR family, response regulator CpxR
MLGTQHINKILIIEHDVDLGRMLRESLEPQGFPVELADDGEHGLASALTDEHRFVVLDTALPGLSGLDVLKRLRVASHIPVLLLTAQGDDIDRIVGLEVGADDCLPKPFNPKELVARVRAILRRVEPPRNISQTSAPERMIVADVELDVGTRTVWQAGRKLELTSVEFELLRAFLCEAGRVVSREELVKRVLGRIFSPYDRSIDMHVSKLRRKLGGQDGDSGRIKTVRGAGYIYSYSGVAMAYQ